MQLVIEHLSRKDNKEPCIILSRDRGQRRMITGNIDAPAVLVTLRGEGSVNVSMDPDTTLHIRPAVDGQ